MPYFRRAVQATRDATQLSLAAAEPDTHYAQSSDRTGKSRRNLSNALATGDKNDIRDTNKQVERGLTSDANESQNVGHSSMIIVPAVSHNVGLSPDGDLFAARTSNRLARESSRNNALKSCLSRVVSEIGA